MQKHTYIQSHYYIKDTKMQHWVVVLGLIHSTAKSALAAGGTHTNHASVSHIHVKHHNIQKCPKGYEYHDDSCIQLQVVPFSTVCPPETKSIDGNCYQESPAESTCPPDYMYNAKQCFKKSIKKASIICQSNDFELKGKECVKTRPGPYICEYPFAIRGVFCEKRQQRLARCPHGYERVQGGDCETRVEYAKIEACDFGYIFDKIKKICTLTTQLPLRCEKKDFVLQDDRCLQFAKKRKECPPEFLEQGNECVKLRESEKTNICLNGGNLMNGKCEYKTENKHSVCQKGVREGDKCVVAKTAEYTLTCPFGYILEGSECSKVEYYDCVKTEPKRCYEPLQVKDAYLHTHEMANKKAYFKHKLLLHNQPHTSVNTDCWKKDFEVREKCQRTRTIKAMERCPPGYEFRDKACVVHAVHDIEVVILPPIIEYSEPLVSCVQGYPPDCIYTERVPATYSCPAGFQQSTQGSDVCVRYDVPVRPSPQIDSVPIRRVCPPEGCVHTLRLPLEYFCEDGFEDDGEGCVYRIDRLKGPDEIITQQPQHVCPDGYENNGFECVHIDIQPPTLLCATGYEILRDMCVYPIQHIHTCPQGDMVENGCLVKHVKHIHLVCEGKHC